MRYGAPSSVWPSPPWEAKTPRGEHRNLAIARQWLLKNRAILLLLIPLVAAATALRWRLLTRKTRPRFSTWFATKPPFSPEAVTEEFAKLMKSEIYVDLLPLLNSRAIDLLENERLLHQLVSLERRTSRSGKDSIDHAPKAHDDLANAAAGALVTAYKEPGFSNFNRKLPQPNIGVY